MKKILFLIVLIMGVLAAVGCSKPEFNGNRTGNDKQFLMDYSVLNKTETHEMSLEAGSTVDVKLENTSGRLDVRVTGPDGEVLYQGDDADSGEFSLSIQKTGKHLFSVTGKDAKGSVSFILAEK